LSTIGLLPNTAGGGNIGEVQKLSPYVLHRIDNGCCPNAHFRYTHEQVDYFFFVIGEAIWRFGEANMCELPGDWLAGFNRKGP